MKQVLEKMALVARELKAVKMANMQRYKARHIYDVYNMIQPLLAKEGILIGRELVSEQTTEVTKTNKFNGKEETSVGTHRYQVWRFKFYAEEGEPFCTEFPAESIDWGDKAASQCDAMAFKQMLIHTFLIPTADMKEPDDKPEMSRQSSKPKETFSKGRDHLKDMVNLQKSHGFDNETMKRMIGAHYQRDNAKTMTQAEQKEFVHMLGTKTKAQLLAMMVEAEEATKNE